MDRMFSAPRRILQSIVTVIVGSACVLAPVAARSEQPAAAAVEAGRAGQRIQIDPQTGARVRPSAPTAAIPPNPAFSTSHQGLVEQAAPGGGVMVDLQGRFRSAATATTGPDGKPVVDCLAPGAGPAEGSR